MGWAGGKQNSLGRLWQYREMRWGEEEGRVKDGSQISALDDWVAGVLQIANIHWIMEKAKEFQKSIYFCSLTILKPLTVWITTNCGKFLKSWDFQTTLSVS